MISLLKDLAAEEAAPKLLGAELIREVNGATLKGKIVEVEAYHEKDPAAHSFSGKTKRNQSMFLEGGHAYVYLSYGIHYCMNVVCGQAGTGEGVLIRALEPISGIETMHELRNVNNKILLTNGPGKLTKAMSIDKNFDGHWLNDEPLSLQINEPLNNNLIQKTTRIGISKGIRENLRFYIKGNEYVSKR